MAKDGQEAREGAGTEISPEAMRGGQVSADPGSSYLITVQMEPQYEEVLDADALHRLSIGVLRAEGAEGPVEVGIVVTTDDEVQALNRQYLGHDYKTDVLAFGMEGGGDFVTPQERPAYLGDVVISYERAAEQAPEYGHSASEEVGVLLIHGLLHLLGYDDTNDADRERMNLRQTDLMAILNYRSQISDL